MNFDNLPFHITFKNKYKIPTTKPLKTLTNYKKSNWPQYTKDIEHTLKNTPLHEDPHTANHLITNAILASDRINIPKGIIKSTHTLIPESITTLILKRNHTRSLNNKNPSLPTLNQHITHLIQQHKKQKWEKHLKADWDHKKISHILWSIVKAFNPKKSTIPINTTITHNNKTAHTDTKKANILKRYFKSTTKHFSNPTHRIINKLTKSLTSTPITITESKTIHANKQSKNNNSSRPHNINIKHLKHLGPIAIKHLTNLYNITINANIIPQIWKASKIIPIAKPNKNPLLPFSYRPIALLSPIKKTLEKIFLPHITTNITLPTHQHGFIAAHFNTTVLHQINNIILTGSNKKNPPIEKFSPLST